MFQGVALTFLSVVAAAFPYDDAEDTHTNAVVPLPYVPEVVGVIGKGGRDLCAFTDDRWRCHNWARTQFWEPYGVFIPHDEDELAGFLQSNTHPLKVVGHAHSWSSLFIPPSNGISLVLHRLSGIVGITDSYVDVYAGGSFVDLHKQLDQMGKALGWFSGGIQGLTIGGAVSVGFHGSQLSLGSISSVVSHMEIYDTDGSRHVLDMSSNRSSLAAVRLGVGKCGVITRVRLPIKPQFYLRRSRWRKNNITSFFLENWWTTHDLFHYYIHPLTQTAWPMTWEHISEQEFLQDNKTKGCRTALEQIEDANEKEFGKDGLPLIMRWDNCSDISYKAYTHAIDMDAQPIWNGEYFLPSMSPADEYKIVKTFLETIFADASIDWWIHMRYMKGSHSFADPCYGWDTCVGIELALVADTMAGALPPKTEWLHYFLQFERYLLSLGGRAHHAKYHTQENKIDPKFYEICRGFDERGLLL
jgi:FAD binding domain